MNTVSKLSLLPVLAMASLFAGCLAGVEPAARLGCKTDLSLNKRETAACKRGTEIAGELVKEHLHWYSSEESGLALLRMAEQQCVREFPNDFELQHGCYAGLAHYRSNLPSHDNR